MASLTVWPPYDVADHGHLHAIEQKKSAAHQELLCLSVPAARKNPEDDSAKQKQSTANKQLPQVSFPGRQVFVKTLVDSKGQRLLQIHGLDEKGIGSLLRMDLPLDEGRCVHAHIVGLGREQHIFFANLLLRMYGKCSDLDDSSSLFCKLHERDLISWNTMLGVYAQEERFVAAFPFLDQLEADKLKPDAVSFLTILKACSRWATLVEGEKTHALVIESGFESNLMLTTALVDMYGSCHSVHQAKATFNKIVVLDVAAWNALMGAHIQSGCLEEVLALFTQMHVEGIQPNVITYVHALSACVNVENLENGNLIHASVVEDSLESDVILSNALITMYGKCGNLQNAGEVFQRMEHRSVVSWTAMVTEYSRHGLLKEALDYFYQMQKMGLQPTKATFVSAVCACAGVEALPDCRKIHILITHMGYESNVLIGTALIDMYGKCGHLTDASVAFRNISQQNVVSWNALIASYAQQGHGDKALKLFRRMLKEEVKPDKVTFLSVIKACTFIKSLGEGKEIHDTIIQHCLELDVVLGNALIDMYGKCAALELAHSTFNDMQEHNVISWTTLISSYAQQGHGATALTLYRNMQKDSIRPNKATFLSLLSACSHAGLVDEGCFYFSSMTNDYGIEPEFEHYGTMVDLYGRAGLLKEAEDFIGKMPIEADACVWTALLGACQMHGDINRGKRASENIACLEVCASVSASGG